MIQKDKNNIPIIPETVILDWDKMVETNYQGPPIEVDLTLLLQEAEEELKSITDQGHG